MYEVFPGLPLTGKDASALDIPLAAVVRSPLAGDCVCFGALRAPIACRIRLTWRWHRVRGSAPTRLTRQLAPAEWERCTKPPTATSVATSPSRFSPTASPTIRLAWFEREARTLASLNHPNIAQIYGVENANGVRALAMELVEGPTLADRIAEGRIPIEEALPIARQIAEALQAAHEQNIIHRDLKPANVKIRPDGTRRSLGNLAPNVLAGRRASRAGGPLRGQSAAAGTGTTGVAAIGHRPRAQQFAGSHQINRRQPRGAGSAEHGKPVRAVFHDQAGRLRHRTRAESSNRRGARRKPHAAESRRARRHTGDASNSTRVSDAPRRCGGGSDAEPGG